MRISRQSHLPVGVEQAFAVVVTEDFQRDKVAAVCTDVSARVTGVDGGITTIHGERVIPTAGMPAAVVAAVGESLRIIEQQTWAPPQDDGSRSADRERSVRGLPLTMRGRAVLAPEPTGTRLTLAGDLTCGLPLVGRKIEKAAAPVIENAFDDEARLLARRVA